MSISSAPGGRSVILRADTGELQTSDGEVTGQALCMSAYSLVSDIVMGDNHEPEVR